MSSEDTAQASWWQRVWRDIAGVPDTARLAGLDDGHFRQSVADLSRRLAERQTADPLDEARARHAAMQRLNREHGGIGRRMAIGLALGVVAGSAIAALLSSLGAPAAPPALSVVARPDAPPARDPDPAPLPVRVASLADDRPAPVMNDAPPPMLAPLSRDDVREIQTRLRGFGFNAGPIDGNAGRLTAAATSQYQQNRSQPPTGTVDRDLLDQLRRDPAPQVAPPEPVRVAQRPPPRPARQPGPFDRFDRWLKSLSR
jgi:hypothetical protein